MPPPCAAGSAKLLKASPDGTRLSYFPGESQWSAVAIDTALGWRGAPGWLLELRKPPRASSPYPKRKQASALHSGKEIFTNLENLMLMCMRICGMWGLKLFNKESVSIGVHPWLVPRDSGFTLATLLQISNGVCFASLKGANWNYGIQRLPAGIVFR